MEKVEDVLLHHKLLSLEKVPDKCPVYHIRFLEGLSAPYLQSTPTVLLQVYTGFLLGGGAIQPQPEDQRPLSCSNLVYAGVARSNDANIWATEDNFSKFEKHISPFS
ncbi:transcription factor bHLH113-like protein isoform X3 [Cucumis melo var. makuwa]|uniref:Transcription factor bHLH113-like isoform X3 n=1 Tax=Cucumis melo var. makuwa TaxID=1194695 RepID=A0A5A7UEM1_CUCMM|nr:transcription factor bHLH113-like isoform X3 [Cucumis melo var. makuwa]TYK19100.1 transcription factor bHLH113-like protein isoform X3 [Cucumis melo var. makuwa]